MQNEMKRTQINVLGSAMYEVVQYDYQDNLLKRVFCEGFKSALECREHLEGISCVIGFETRGC